VYGYRLREESGLPQARLAEKVECHLSNINRIEPGKYTPALETVVRVAATLDIPVDYLINSTDGSPD